MTGIPVSPGELVDVGYLNEVARAHYRKTTAKAVVNSIVETDLLNGEITIGAGAMSTARVLRLTAWGDSINNTGGAVATPRWKLKLGATTLIDSNVLAATWSASANRMSWRVQAEIANLGAANSQWTAVLVEQFIGIAATLSAFATTGEGGTTAVTAGGVGPLRVQVGNASAVDTTAAQVLALTITLATANALEDVTLKGAIVEIV